MHYFCFTAAKPSDTDFHTLHICCWCWEHFSSSEAHIFHLELFFVWCA